ncbi:MAG: class IV adenylate cyclase [Candidatus Micrarchaeota archaeon]
MAHENVEVEIKIPVVEKKFAGVKSRLAERAEFVKESRQSDEYFTPAHRNFVEPAFPSEWLSIRERGGKTILNYKHWRPDNADVKTHCDEYETEVSDAARLRKLLDALDFRKLVTVEKKRLVYRVGNDFEIALDEVAELGFFIEIEALKDFGGVEATREKLFEYAGELGLDARKEFEKRGYPYMLMKKKGFVNLK